MSVEKMLCEGMGFEHCILFSRARVALAYAIEHLFGRNHPLFIPSNVCPALANAVRDAILLPVGAQTGLSIPTGELNVQLYGYRQESECELEVDTLMTGWGRTPSADSTIISFGYSKTIDLGLGGALLTSNNELAKEMRFWSDWPDELTEKLKKQIEYLPENILRRLQRMKWWRKELGDLFYTPGEPVIPWRYICLIPGARDAVARSLHLAGIDAGMNYPPLPGCSDRSSKAWGADVLNLWLSDEYDQLRIAAASEIIKRTVAA